MISKFRGAIRSRTVWLGFAVVAVTWLQNNTDVLVGLFPTKYADLAGYGIGIAIWFFRWITTKPLEDKVPEPKIEPLPKAKRQNSSIAQERWETELDKNDLEDF